MFKNFVSLALAFLLIGVTPATAQNSQPGIWYFPPGDIASPKGFVRDQDFQKLFTSPLTWPNALSHVSVFGMPRSFIQKASDGELQSAFTFLNAHHIGLSVSWPGVDGTIKNCGEGDEGINHNRNVSLNMAKRLKTLGAPLEYIILDESLRFGHYPVRKAGCQYDIPDVAAQVGNTISEVQQVYPGVKVYDTEPTEGMGSIQDFDLWLESLKRALGGTLLGMDFDVQWEKGKWQAEVPAMVQALKQNGLSYGLIVDGGPHDPSNEAWVKSAQQNVQQWSQVISDRPDHLRFQSWHQYPTHALPENDPGTILYLLNWYVSTQGSR